MSREIALESEEWYVLCNWLRSRENKTMYALRSRSEEWEYVYELRRFIEAQLADGEETDAALQTVVLSDSSVSYLAGFLRRRAFLLLFKPWRDRERRDVRRLRRQFLARA